MDSHKHYRLMVWVAIMVAAAGFYAKPIYAAPLNFVTGDGIYLSSPASSYSIATGSVADMVTITTSSISVALSNSTGGSFSLISPSYDLAVATSSGGGAVTISCLSGTEEAVLSQVSGSTVYTITPSGTTCAASAPPVISNISTSGITTASANVSWTTNVAATTTIEYGTDTSYGSNVDDLNDVTADTVTLSGLSAGTTYHFAIVAYANGTSTTSGDNTFTTSPASSGGGGGGGGSSGGGGGGGGGGSYYIPPPVVTSGGASTSTTSTTSTTLNSLGGLLNLIAEVRALSLQMFVLANNDRTLTIGAQGQDVWALQVFLITNNILTPTGPAANKLTNPTGYFGTLTENALAEYQSKVGISPTSGLLGPKTRAYLQSLNGGTAPSPAPISTPTVAPSEPAQTSGSTISLSFGSSGSAVTNLQDFLVQNGYLTNGVFIPGTFDTATQRAVEIFQCLEKIVCSGPGYGTVGPRTQALINVNK